MNFSKLTTLVDTMPKRGIPFFDLAVTQNGKSVFRHMAGASDADGKKPIDERDLYWLFSTSKVITCVAAMRLVEEGKLDLNAPVSRYLPAFRNLTVKKNEMAAVPCQNEMTVEQLFTMTGGMNYNLNTAPILRAKQRENADTLSIVNAMAESPLDFEPGTHYRYSLCHDVLAAVVEVVSGMRFSDYVQKMIFDPLEIRDMGFRPTEEQAARFAASFQYDNSNGTATPIPTQNAYAFSPRYDSGGAGLFGCTTEYIKILTALSCDGMSPNGYRLLKPETIAQMEVNHLNPVQLRDFVQGRLHGYGWGLCGRVHINPDFSLSPSSIGEFGWDGAGGCFAMVDRAKHTAIFYGMQTHNCAYSYIILQPLIRAMVLEALQD